MSYNIGNMFSTSKPTRTKTNVNTTTGGSIKGETAGADWLALQKEKMAAGAPGYEGANPYASGPNKWQQQQGQGLNTIGGEYGAPGGYWDQEQDIYGNVGGMNAQQLGPMDRSGGPGAGYMNPYQDQMLGGLQKDYGESLAMMKNQIGAGAGGANAFGGARHGVAEGVGGAKAMDDYLRSATGIRADSYDKGMQYMGQDQNRNIAIANANNRANLGFGNMQMDAASRMGDPTNRLNVNSAIGQYGNYQDTKDISGKNWLKGNWDDRNTREDQWGRDYMSGVSGTPWQTTSTTTGTQTGQGKSNFDKTMGYGLMAKATFKCIPEGTKIDTQGGGQIAIEDIKAGTKVKGYYKAETEVLQVHQYKEDRAPHRFYRITFDNGGTVDCCDMHKIYNKPAKDYRIGDRIQNTKVTSIGRYNGVERSYDLLTADGGYLIGGVPVNSMIEELAELAVELKQAAEAA